MSNTKYSLNEINKMDKETCYMLLSCLANSKLADPILYECIASRPYENFIHLRNFLYDQFNNLNFLDTLELLRSNDVLGANAKELTGKALNEQIKSGLQNLSPYDKQRLDTLNSAYKAKFSFNFICVTKNLTKDEIFSRFEKRLSNDFETEFLFSIIQLKKLLHLRLSEIIIDQELPIEVSFFKDNLNEYAQSYLTNKTKLQ